MRVLANINVGIFILLLSFSCSSDSEKTTEAIRDKDTVVDKKELSKKVISHTEKESNIIIDTLCLFQSIKLYYYYDDIAPNPYGSSSVRVLVSDNKIGDVFEYFDSSRIHINKYTVESDFINLHRCSEDTVSFFLWYNNVNQDNISIKYVLFFDRKFHTYVMSWIPDGIYYEMNKQSLTEIHSMKFIDKKAYDMVYKHILKIDSELNNVE